MSSMVVPENLAELCTMVKRPKGDNSVKQYFLMFFKLDPQNIIFIPS